MCTLLVKASQFGSLVLFSFKKKEKQSQGTHKKTVSSKPPARVCCYIPYTPILASTHLELSHREGISVTETFDLMVPDIKKMIEPWLRKRISLKQIKVNAVVEG